MRSYSEGLEGGNAPAPVGRRTNLPDERRIIDRVLAGEKEEFAQLVQRYQNQVYAIIFRQTGNQALSRDLAQDTFVRAYRHLAGFRGDASFGTWITRIAMNVTRSYLSSRVHQEQMRSTEIDAGHDVPAAEVEQSILNEALHLNLRKHVQDLRPKYRDVLVLCAFENKSYKEAAEILEVPLGTICSRMNAAINLLRRKFKLG
jgi:RNA polymerase sigma-70 factor (ECF subfamily)